MIPLAVLFPIVLFRLSQAGSLDESLESSPKVAVARDNSGA